jgi:hypothetical protein
MSYLLFKHIVENNNDAYSSEAVMPLIMPKFPNINKFWKFSEFFTVNGSKYANSPPRWLRK